MFSQIKKISTLMVTGLLVCVIATSAFAGDFKKSNAALAYIQKHGKQIGNSTHRMNIVSGYRASADASRGREKIQTVKQKLQKHRDHKDSLSKFTQGARKKLMLGYAADAKYRNAANIVYKKASAALNHQINEVKADIQAQTDTLEILKTEMSTHLDSGAKISNISQVDLADVTAKLTETKAFIS